MILGVVLAGGRGARLERHEPKALLMLAGRTLLARAEATLEALCDEVLVSAPQILALGARESRRIADPEDAEGPLAGMVAALSARPYVRALVLAVDLPFATPNSLRALGEFMREGDDVVMAAPEGIPQPLAAWYAPRAALALSEALARGERSATRAVLRLNARVVDSEQVADLPDGLTAYFNLNTPADLDEAQRRCREGAP